MNEEEAELLPPYLRPYPPAGAPLGTLSYNRRSKCWVAKRGSRRTGGRSATSAG